MATDTKTIEISNAEKLPTSPLVSVYMLTYNHEKYIAQAIEGVTTQRCEFPIELIIGEDCSTDRTQTIARDYQRKYPHLIRILTANRNVGAHANAARCTRAARGRFIAICEGDDYWQNPNKLRLQAAIMSDSPTISLCHTDFDRRIGFRVKKNRHSALAREHLTEANVYANLLIEWTVMTATAMYRTEIIDEFRRSPFYDPRWPFGDYNLALYASLKGTVAYIPISTATWRRITGSASNSGPRKALSMHMAATECRHRFMDAYPVSQEQREAIERAIHTKYLRLAYLANRPDIYIKSLDWLRSHGYESKSLAHISRLVAMRSRLLIPAMNVCRSTLRTMAEFEI